MRTLLLFILACIGSPEAHAASIQIPEDQAMMISLPDPVNGIIGVTLGTKDSLTFTTEKYQTKVATVDQDTLKAIRAKVIDCVSRFAPPNTDQVGPGYKSLSIMVGMTGTSCDVMWGWNDKKNVPIPDPAKEVLTAVRPFLDAKDQK